jgi:uncharacterized protein YcfJ
MSSIRRKNMISRILGALAGAFLGALIGSGTGIVGGVFGAIAGIGLFIFIGAAWGVSAGPDIAKQLNKWRSK